MNYIAKTAAVGDGVVESKVESQRGHGKHEQRKEYHNSATVNSEEKKHAGGKLEHSERDSTKDDDDGRWQEVSKSQGKEVFGQFVESAHRINELGKTGENERHAQDGAACSKYAIFYLS